MKASQVKNTGYNEPFIAQRADPFIGKAPDGTYYFTASVPEYDRLVVDHKVNIFGRQKFTMFLENGICIMRLGRQKIYGKFVRMYYSAKAMIR